jgi:sugar/nucleoside kinase (ribokinase family)
MNRAIEMARAAGGRVAFTLSDSFCVDRHRGDFRELIDDGRIDILFANENELLSLAQEPELDRAIAAVAGKLPLLVVTRSEHGAIAIEAGARTEMSAEPVEKVVDSTGAGDMFAAGFLTGQAQGRSLEQSLRIGAIVAAEVISHYGARPEADLGKLVAEKLG